MQVKLIFLFFILAVSTTSYSQKKEDSQSHNSNITPMVAQLKFHKFEISGGYSHNFTECCVTSDQFSSVEVFNPSNGFTTIITGQFDTKKRAGFNGFNVTATYNFSRFIGATLDLSGYYGKGETLLFGGRESPNLGSSPQLIAYSDKAPQSSYSYMGGLRVKDNNIEKKFKPFAYALFGISQLSSSYPGNADERVRKLYFPDGGNKIRISGFSMAFGGGLDISVSKHIDIRPIQFDYNLVSLKEKGITRSDPDNYVTKAILGIGGYKLNNFRLGAGIVVH